VAHRGVALEAKVGASLFQRLDHEQRVRDRDRIVVVRVQDQQGLLSFVDVLHRRGFRPRCLGLHP
jgi:hypothetical protein